MVIQGCTIRTHRQIGRMHQRKSMGFDRSAIFTGDDMEELRRMADRPHVTLGALQPIG